MRVANTETEKNMAHPAQGTSMTIRSRMVVWTLALTFLFTCRPMQAQTEPLGGQPAPGAKSSVEQLT
jgi:hypothetical protein